MSNRIVFNYDRIQNFSKMMQKESDELDDWRKKTDSMVENLHDGNWIGRGSDKFFSEMEGEVLPAMQRTVNALQSASRVLEQIAETYYRAEEEIQGYFSSLGE